MHIILFDDLTRYRLLPFTHTRPLADIRCGIYTMRQRWEHCLQQNTGTLTEYYLQNLFQTNAGFDNLFINGAIFGNRELCAAASKLSIGQKLVQDDLLIAFRTDNHLPTFEHLEKFVKNLPEQKYDGLVNVLNNVWDIFSYNYGVIVDDFALITEGKTSQPIPEGVTVSGKENLFIEEGAKIYAGCIINATVGPVYIGKGSEVLEGSMIRGPLAICEQAVVKMGTKLYGATTIGPSCKVGGEINNVVFFANSNKAHDGYLGNAVIGEWCNLGADTNCSNLKNNYDEVQVWDEHYNKALKTGLTFCGLLMGDHSKCSINTMFNTGTVVGVSCNIFGHGFPAKFVPSFCWGGSEGMTTYDFERAMETAKRMMARRDIQLSETEIAMYRHIFEHTSPQRNLFTQA
jgi:UDP-N-acetylglucosamine diphosphorylase/glucosamine-1-phosphate N-acetyltransferase